MHLYKFPRYLETPGTVQGVLHSEAKNNHINSNFRTMLPLLSRMKGAGGCIHLDNTNFDHEPCVRLNAIQLYGVHMFVKRFYDMCQQDTARHKAHAQGTRPNLLVTSTLQIPPSILDIGGHDRGSSNVGGSNPVLQNIPPWLSSGLSSLPPLVLHLPGRALWGKHTQTHPETWYLR